MTEPEITFRAARPDDWERIWPIFQAVVATGDTYAYDPDTPQAVAEALWMLPGVDRHVTFVAERGTAVVATAILRPNTLGLGDHVCNAAWMVAPSEAGQGIGRRFAEFVMHEAREFGFEAMQFNAVVASNHRAIALWQSLGFRVVGTVPKAFRHAVHGMTDIHMMHRFLDD